MVKTFELNKVYEELSTGHLYYVRKVKRTKGRNKYLLRRVTKTGSLGAKRECFFKRALWKARPDYIDKVFVVPTSDRKKTKFQLEQEKGYKQLVMKTRRIVAEEKLRMKSAGTKVFNDTFKYTIAQYAFASTCFVDYSKGKNKSKFKTLRQFAKDIGMTRNKRYYDWVCSFYSQRQPQELGKLRKHFDKMADRTLVTSRNRLEERWHSLYGFSQQLNNALEIRRDIYESLIFERGIYLEESK
jgi:hypothetical protein